MNTRRIWATVHPFYEDGGIMGRSVANEGFINALVRSGAYDEHHFFLADEGAVAAVGAALARRFPARHEAGAFTLATRHVLPEALAQGGYTLFHLSDCISDMVPLMRLRNAVSPTCFSITGTTHSLSYARYSMNFFDLLWPGVTPRDAIIATSQAGAGAVAAMFERLRAGYGLGEEFCAPRIAPIPLGVEPDDFAPPEEKPGLGATARAQFGIAADDLVLLVFARLSHYSKMDILPLFRALVRAESQGLPKGRYTLVLAGRPEGGDACIDGYEGIAARLGIALRVVLSPDAAGRRGLFAAADIFLSPVDNPQETFGLTMLEAGAAGLPVVASDFDGYRDLVVHGETGFLIPTIGPGATPESDALAGVWFDNQHHLQLAQQSVVAVPELGRAIGTLAQDAALRARMGAAGRRRVLGAYTWAQVVAQHVGVWDELAAAPLAGPAKAAHPLHPGYASVFGGYYSILADGAAARSVVWSVFGEAVYRSKDYPAIYAGVERLVALPALRYLLFRARKPVPLGDLLPGGPPSPASEREAFLVLWALKHDLLEFASPAQ